MVFLADKMYLTDGGLETVLIFDHGLDLPEFASFPLLNDEKGAKILYDYYLPFIDAAKQNGMGFILESPTWRASLDWGKKLGFDEPSLNEININSINLLKLLQHNHTTPDCPIIISGCIGPRGDGYIAGDTMSVEEAISYHRQQVSSFADAEVDVISCITMTNIPEALALTKLADENEIPVIISFTVETDGTLPSGETLQVAIETVDQITNNTPLYYMINCAHPSHFEGVLDASAPWVQRIQGVRANASRLSHAELDEMVKIDDGDPVELGQDYKNLKKLLPNLRVMGGCCGTDHRHVSEMGKALAK